jgi:glycolate oxidase FAD binding subunit
LQICTTGLHRTLEHNASDMTARFEAGVPLARAQAELAAEGQMLAVDPPDGEGRATLGGVFATADSGPLRHRYGQPRDLVLGITVALADGTIAQAGSRVIKNVAGYDLPKLFTGAYGTLGMILSLTVRLHPLPLATATARARTDDPRLLAAAAIAVARAPHELESFDVAWSSGRGELLARAGGADAAGRAESVARAMRASSLDEVEVSTQDDDLWARIRAAQRSRARAILRVACAPTDLPKVLAFTNARATSLVGRAALGVSFIELEPAEIEPLRRELPRGASAVVLDLPEASRGSVDPWGVPLGSPAVELMRSIKRRFDPAAVCSPGVFVGGI